jgi:hypothetical protein
MALPKTNLFKGDRVRLSDAFLATRKHDRHKFAAKRGVIITDTLNPNAEFISVVWGDNKRSGKNDVYMPIDLTLWEDEDEHRAATDHQVHD